MSGKLATQLAPGDRIWVDGVERIVKREAHLSEVYRDTWDIELEPVAGRSDWAECSLAYEWKEPEATVPVSVLRELADEFELRSRSGQVVNTEAEGVAMRAAYREAAVEIRRRIP